MNNATHFVIDLETMGKGPLAPIAAIGAVCVAQGAVVDEFYIRIDLQSSLSFGLRPDASTLQWWLRQSDEARREVDGREPTEHLSPALIDLRHWMLEHASEEEAHVWGNGSSFDNVILRGSLDAAGLDEPWQFRHDRDLRTLLALYPEAKNVGEFEGTKHHALHDARHEAKQLIAALAMHYGLAWGSYADLRIVRQERDSLRAQLLSQQSAPNIEAQGMTALTRFAIPTTPGTPFEGSFYVGRFMLNAVEYALIVSPKAQGELDEAAWGVDGATSCNDGLANTQAMATAGSDMARRMLALDIAGFTDWYLPSRDELELCYRNLKPTDRKNCRSFCDGDNPSSLPAGYPYTADNPAKTTASPFIAAGEEAFEPQWYWASTQSGPTRAWTRHFNDGYQDDAPKDNALRARAVRRFKVIP
ncbi:3'-5' exoribonuclease domain-containing protein [Azorhizophilus paspali]|uniref:3'-5' exoribonuclease domain-containing protein n=1 Tax=Azorhizophilus paspali TaxID=69963 RepID=A0ABV6SJW1_AZOPA